MSATALSGEEYAFYYDHRETRPFIHGDTDCDREYTSDMTMSAAIRAVLSGEMQVCPNCMADSFPIRTWDTRHIGDRRGPIEHNLDVGGTMTFLNQKVVWNVDVHPDDLHRRARQTLYDENILV